MVLGGTPLLSLLRNFIEITGYCLLFLTLDKPCLPWKKTCLYYSVFILLYTALGFVWCLSHAESYAVLCTITFYIQSFFFLLRMSSDNIYQVIYHISYQVFILLFQLYICVKCAQLFFDGNAWVDVALRLVFLAISVCINLCFFRRIYRDIVETIQCNWKGLCLIALAGNLLVIYFGVYPAHVMVRSVKDQIVFVCFCLLLSFTHLVMLKMLFSIRKELMTSRELELSIRRSELLESELAVIQESVEEIRRLRHDVRHHNLMIAEYARNGEQEELGQYLDEYIREAKRCRQAVFDREEQNLFGHPSQKRKDH